MADIHSSTEQGSNGASTPASQTKVQLLRVYLPENHTTLLQVKDEMTMGEILKIVCEKKMLDVSAHVLSITTGGRELEALPGDKYGIYQHATEVRLKKKQYSALGLPLDVPIRTGRRASVQLNAPKSEIKMGGIDFPLTVTDEAKDALPTRKTSRPNTLTSISTLFRKLDTKSVAVSSAGSLPSDEAARSPSRERSPSIDSKVATSQESDESFMTLSNRVTELSLNSSNGSGESLSPSEEVPASPISGTAVQFHRKRTGATTSKTSTLKRSTFRARSISEQTAAKDLSGSIKENSDFVLVRIQVESDFTTMKIPTQSPIEDILRHVTDKFSLVYEEYTVEFPDGTKGDLDRTLQHYLQNARVAELRIVKGPKSFSTISIIENGEECMVLSISKDKHLVMSGTPEKLIERATDDSEKDMQFTDTFLLTFRSFMKPLEVFDELIARFNATLPPDPSPEDISYFEKSKGMTQMKVIEILKLWTQNYWHDYAFNPILKEDLEDFVEVLDSIPEFIKYSKELRQTIEQQMEREEQIQNLHRSIDSKKKTMESMFETVEIEELAKQICIHNFELYKNIHPIEFLNQIWRKKDSGNEWSTPNLDFFSSRFDRESYWVATEILSQKDIKKRSNYLKRFIQLGKECQILNNFFSMFAIYVGLNLTPVQRLKKTWESMSPRVKQIYDELEKACDPSKNMKAYRDLLQASKPPILPFLPIYLKDLTFMNDGNSSMFKNMINFDKLRMMANRVRDITNLAESPYTFEAIPALQNYLHKPHVEMNLTKLKEESLKCEGDNK